MRYLILAAALLSACTSSNAGGKCIGVLDKEQPGVEYRLATRNVVVGVVFVETLIVPAVVVFDEIKCPVVP